MVEIDSLTSWLFSGWENVNVSVLRMSTEDMAAGLRLNRALESAYNGGMMAPRDMDNNARDLYTCKKAVLNNHPRKRRVDLGGDTIEYKVASYDDNEQVIRDTIMTVRILIKEDGGIEASLIRKGADIVKLHTDHNHTNRRGDSPVGCPHKHYRNNGKCKRAYYVDEDFEMGNVASVVDAFFNECRIFRNFEIPGSLPI